MIELNTTIKKNLYIAGNGEVAPTLYFGETTHDKYLITCCDILGIVLIDGGGEPILAWQHNQTIELIDSTHPDMEFAMSNSHWKQLGETVWYYRYANPDGYVRVATANNSFEYELKSLQAAVKSTDNSVGITLDEDDYTLDLSANVASNTLDDQILDVDNWVLVGDRYEYEFSNEAILASSIVFVVPLKSTLDIVKLAEIDPFTLSANGKVTIYAVNEPTDDINVQIIIME